MNSNFFIFKLLPTISLAGAQLILFPFISIALGFEQGTDTLIILITLIGLAIGESRKIALKFISSIYIVSGLTLLVIALVYRLFITGTAEYWPLKVFSTTIIFFTLILVGFSVSSSIYFKKTAQKNYFHLNLLASIATGIWFIFLPNIGFQISLAVIALFITIGGFYLKFHDFQEMDIKFEEKSISWISIISGFISGGTVSCLLLVSSIAIYPTGIRFPIYLILTFLLLAIAAKISISFKRLLRFTDCGLVSLTGLLILLAIFNLIFSGPNNTFYLDPLKLFLTLPQQLQSYYFLQIIIIFILFLPYLLFAFILPIQEKLKPNVNHLFFITCGNILGFIIFYWILSALSIKIKLSILIISAIGLAFFTRAKKNIISLKILISLSLISLILITPKNIEKRIISQNIRLAPTLFFKTNQIKEIFNERKHKIEEFAAFTKHGREIAFVTKRFSFFKTLGLGGYLSPMFRTYDLIKATSIQLLTSQTKKQILVLGLGNHMPLKYLQASFEQKGIKNYQIDVVEISKSFKNKKFAHVLREYVGLNDLENKNTNYIFQDAFQFVAKVQRPFYDIVVWNLTWPTYESAIHLYTKEFIGLLKKSLKGNGLLVYPFMGNKELDCLVTSQFNNTIMFPKAIPFPIGLLISSNDELSNYTLEPVKYYKKDICKQATIPNLNNPFWNRSFHFQLFPKTDYNYNQTVSANLDLSKLSIPEAIANATQSRFPSLSTPLGIPVIGPLPLTGKLQSYGINFIDTFNMFFKTKLSSKAWYLTPIDSFSNNYVSLKDFYIQKSYLSKNAIEIAPIITDIEKNTLENYLREIPLSLKKTTFTPYPNEKSYFHLLSLLSIDPGINNFAKDIRKTHELKNDKVTAEIFIDENFTFKKEYINQLKESLLKEKFIISKIHSLSTFKTINRNYPKNHLFIFLLESYKQIPQTNDLRTIINNPKAIIFSSLQTVKMNLIKDMRNTSLYFPWHPTISKQACEFARMYSKMFKKNPAPFNAYSYSIMELINANIHANRNLAGKKTDYPTVSGPINWNKNGMRTNTPRIIQFIDKNGRETLFHSQDKIYPCNKYIQKSKKLRIAN